MEGNDEAPPAVIFRNQIAWFSCSVSTPRQRKWKDNGGEVNEENYEEADFVFSQDPNSQDTKKLHESKAYLEEHLAVIHPSYIDECVRVGNMKKVPLGKYFLPPNDVIRDLMNKTRFPWTLEEAEKQVPISKGNSPLRPGTRQRESTGHGGGASTSETSAEEGGMVVETTERQGTSGGEEAGRSGEGTSRVAETAVRKRTTQGRELEGKQREGLTKSVEGTSTDKSSRSIENSRPNREAENATKNSGARELIENRRTSVVREPTENIGTSGAREPEGMSPATGQKRVSSHSGSSSSRRKRSKETELQLNDINVVIDIADVDKGCEGTTCKLEDFTPGKNGCEVLRV